MRRSTVLLLIAFHFLLAGLVVRAVSYAFDRSDLSRELVDSGRFRALWKNSRAFTRHAFTRNLFFGFSATQFFLDPKVYDSELEARGVRLKSYNVGFAGSMGAGLDALTRRLGDLFERKHARLCSAVFELEPAAMGGLFHGEHLNAIDIFNPLVFYSGADWAKFLARNPPVALRSLIDLSMRPLEAEAYPPVYNFFETGFRPSSNFGANEIWLRPMFIEKVAWNIANRGHSNWNLPRTEKAFRAAYDQIHLPGNWRAMVRSMVRYYGIPDRSPYDDELFGPYLDSIRTVEKFSRKVFVMVIPAAPSLESVLLTKLDTDAAIARARAETGAEVIDLRKAFALTDADFVDGQHPTIETMNRFLTYLAARTAGFSSACGNPENLLTKSD